MNIPDYIASIITEDPDVVKTRERLKRDRSKSFQPEITSSGRALELQQLYDKYATQKDDVERRDIRAGVQDRGMLGGQKTKSGLLASWQNQIITLKRRIQKIEHQWNTKAGTRLLTRDRLRPIRFRKEQTRSDLMTWSNRINSAK